MMLPDYETPNVVKEVKEDDKEESGSLDLSVISDVNFKTENDELDIAADL